MVSAQERMKELVHEQEKLGLQITQLLSNCKKDSSSRKTVEYVTDRCDRLEKIWKQIEANDEKIHTLEDSEHVYVTKNYYAKLEDKYNECKTYLATCQKAVEPTTNNDQELRLKKQKFKLLQLESDISQIALELLEEKSKSRYQFQMEKIKKQWDTIEAMHEELMLNEDTFQDTYFAEDTYKLVQNKYEEVVEKILNKIQPDAAAAASVTSTILSQPQQNLQIPRISIPIFHGGYENWPTFFDLFKRIIHENKALSKSEKIHFLKTHTRGEASKLIQHLESIEANYETAWELLQKRYENKRMLIFKLIDTLLDLPSISKECAHKLRQLYDVTSECMQAIRNLNVNTDTWGPIIIRTIIRKWDSETNRLYEQSLDKPHEIPDFKEFMTFLERRAQSLETISSPIQEKKTSNANCLYCRDQHMTYHCQKFKALPAQERNKCVKEKRICYNCLSHDVSRKCFSQTKCNICSRQHHTLLHMEKLNTNHNRSSDNQRRNFSGNHYSQQSTTRVSQNNNPTYQGRSVEQFHSRQTTTNHTSKKEENALLATALVKVETSSAPQPLRILIDQGSQSSFITEEAAQRLGLPRRHIRAEISGVGDGEPKISKWSIDATIKPRFRSAFSMEVNMIVLPRLTQSMPKQQLYINSIENWKNEVLADPTFMNPGYIDGILGAKEYATIMLNGMQKTPEGLLKQNTELGWIVSGPILTESQSIQIVSMIAQYEEDKQLTKFWEIEEIPTTQQITVEEQACEDFYQQTTTRDSDGRFVIRIPLKKSPEMLGHSKPRAAARLANMERKFQQDKNLEEQYTNFMKEYLDLGHMKKVTRQEVNQGRYYIPHQAVIRESSTTTRLRVVFDASCKSSTGVSLNDVMHVGPRLQQNIADILIRWRKHEFAFCADIEKMYRQIKVHPDDQSLQRILWREDNAKPMFEYELTTVTYGTAAAPYLAIKTLQKLAIDEAQEYPAASQATLQDFYVDDILSGSDCVETALQLQKQLIQMLSSAGFNLRKWSSNKPALLQSLPEEFRDQKIQELPQEDAKKSLGVLWSPTDDTFKFQVQQNFIINNNATKRQILSEISKLFDPLGWLAPIVIQAKLIIQDLWLRKLEWDQPVDKEMSTRWIQFQSKIKAIENIKIPRWMHYKKSQMEMEKIELHGFCDASEKAYGAVIYSRIRINKKYEITLLQAKSKVAPAKSRTTLPRLELCAAVLLSKLIQKTKSALKLEDVETYAWTDSMITLGWINGNPTRWQTFVANRVCEIHRNAPHVSWNHVKSQENPADIISRGLDADKLQSSEIWWKGPQWISSLEELPITTIIPEVKEEIKTRCLKVEVQIQSDLIERFSNLTRMLRVLSYCNRFMERKNSPILSVEEIKRTCLKLIKLVQTLELAEEYKSLQRNNFVNKQSKLQNLSPFLDQDGIMRVGGRLENSCLLYEQKHPIILPYHSHLSKLIIMDAHSKTLHGGNQATLSYVRNQFWIINGKRAVKNEIKNCVTCIRYKAKTATQLMGQLPKTRVNPAPPFTNTGVDYAGPIQIRATKGRGHKSYKGYISVFVCLATKAIHLEVVSDMTTEAFLAAFQRFTARRGHCAHMYSDNGTTFVGASRLFEDEIKELTKEATLQNAIVNMGTQWHFIPPGAPHFGGIWEAGVKSMKHHLRRVIGESTLTYEELTTLLHQIEACLNSRPLCPLTEDVDDISVLTPGHFLIGRELLAPPDEDSTTINWTQRWRLVQKIKKNLWNAWCTEYLTRLQNKYKWKNQSDNLKEGIMVIIKEDNINPNQWPLGRITETHPGQDGAVRVVSLKKAGGTIIKRPIHKLIPLPADEIKVQSLKEKLVAEEERKTTEPKNRTQRSPRWNLLHTLMAIFMFISVVTAQSGYKINYPQQGIYVEHLGSAIIDRGTFRMKMCHSKNRSLADTKEVSNVVFQFTELCNKSKELTDEVKCTSLVHHLEEIGNHTKWILDTINNLHHKRSKRGIFGKLLTAVFGVNDEVYQDIEALNKNQQELIRASNHQTKFMVSAITTFNETEARIYNKLRHFQERLNEGIEAINSMQTWYKQVDTNALNIHLLSSYNIALNFISETNEYYDKLLDIQFNRGTIYDLVSPAYVHEVIEESNKKLPSNLKIITPALTTQLTVNSTHVQVLGYFSIAEVTEFTLIRATPVPLKFDKGFYWAQDSAENYMAVDYNNQKYFELNEEELQQCIKPHPNLFICSPVSVRNTETNPSCIIDEIYEQPRPRHCNIQKHKIESILWKQLHAPNTWMFITNSVTRIAVMCNGVREDVAINATGIIQISQECTIQTKHNILNPKRSQTFTILGSYSKAIPINVTNFNSNRTTEHMNTEPVLRIKDNLNQLTNAEDDIKEQLHKEIWQNIHHHSSAVSSCTSIGIIGIILAIWYTIRSMKRRRATRQNRKDDHNQEKAEEVELQSLRSSILERGENV